MHRKTRIVLAAEHGPQHPHEGAFAVAATAEEQEDLLQRVTGHEQVADDLPHVPGEVFVTAEHDIEPRDEGVRDRARVERDR